MRDYASMTVHDNTDDKTISNNEISRSQGLKVSSLHVVTIGIVLLRSAAGVSSLVAFSLTASIHDADYPFLSFLLAINVVVFAYCLSHLALSFILLRNVIIANSFTLLLAVCALDQFLLPSGLFGTETRETIVSRIISGYDIISLFNRRSENRGHGRLILSYLLIAATSAAVSGLDVFHNHCYGSCMSTTQAGIAFSFMTFFALAASSLISGYRFGVKVRESIHNMLLAVSVSVDGPPFKSDP